TAAIVLLLLALRLRQPAVSRRFRVGAGLAGLAIVWFSQASVLVLCGLGAAFAILWLTARDRPALQTLLLTVPLWALGCAVAAALAHQSPLQGRLMFYLMPGLLLAIANGMAWLSMQAGRLHVALARRAGIARHCAGPLPGPDAAALRHRVRPDPRLVRGRASPNRRCDPCDAAPEDRGALLWAAGRGATATVGDGGVQS